MTRGRGRASRLLWAAAAGAVATSVVSAGVVAASVASSSAAAPIAAAAPRVAVIIGNDTGETDETPLRYAEADARRIAEILTTVGDLSPADAILMLGRSAADVRRALRDAEARLVRAGGDGLLVVYYSGHADAEALHLGGTSLPLAELQALLHDSAVSTRVLVIDACRSGALTRTKGGTLGGSFEMRLGPAPNPRGLAIVTSSAAGEESQESDELHASFFTHHLASALVGAADLDADGAVTLAEAFSYAARHTLAATATTFAGPQHATYRLELGGREDLVLTRPGRAASLTGAALGRLALHEPGTYLIRRQGDARLAEVSSDVVDRPLALPPGRYEVVRRASDHVMTGTFTVAAAGSTAVTDADMRRLDFGRAVRKGGTTRARAFGLYAGAALRGSLVGLGGAMGGGLGARLDLRGLSVTAAVDYAAGSIDSARGTRLETAELGLRGGVLRPFDLWRLTIAVGGEAGVSRLAQTGSDQPRSTSSYAASAGPALVIDVPLSRRVFFLVQAGLPVYVVDVEDDSHASSGYRWRPTYRVAAAAGGYL